MKIGSHDYPLPQIRVLRILFAAKGPLPRNEIADRLPTGRKSTVMIGRAIGYSDPADRLAFEQSKDGGGTPGNPCPSLLSLDYVREIELEVAGRKETCIELTDKGRSFVRRYNVDKLTIQRDEKKE